MVMTGFYPGSNFEDTLYYDIEHRNLGGVILMGYNLDNPTQIADLSANLQINATTPLFIATDQEGGNVARLNGSNGFTGTYTAYYLGSKLNKEIHTRAEAAKMARWLLQCGINTNLAPVADVNVNSLSPAIGYYGRSFSSIPLRVRNHAYWFYSEFKDRNIISALKHFPGHGSAENDSHDGFTDITNTWTNSELIPFSEMIDTGYTDMIMTAHLYNAQLDSIYPATLSHSTLTGILRDSLGFHGVIISDAMGMGAINNNYSFTESVVQAILAGVDILLYTSNEKYQRSVVKQIVKVVSNAVNAGTISEARIDESYDRIMKLKAMNKTAIRPIVADRFELKAYPNPFNPRTKIAFRLEQEYYETAQLNIFSIDGKLVQRYFLALNGIGNYDVIWNAKDLNGESVPSGTYIFSLDLKDEIHSGKMTLLK